MYKSFRFLNRTIWLVSLVSLFTDMASEMLYPIMPLYLKQIGFNVAWIGFLEGFAEALAGLSKPLFGRWSDSRHQRSPFIQWGYALSAISKPLLIVMPSAIWVFLCRSADRLGKGIRSGARDAMLSDAATESTRGRVFGWHRAMDTLGAVLGPLWAIWYLQKHPEAYRYLFLWAIIPGFIAVLLTRLLNDNSGTKPKQLASGSLLQQIVKPFSYWQMASPDYKKVMYPLGAIALVNSSDMLLLLYTTQQGMLPQISLYLYLVYNVLYALFAFPMGRMADRIGFKPILLFGLCLMALVYGSITFCSTNTEFFIVFALYGLYAACTEGLAKAWLSTLCEPHHRAEALGLLSGVQSLGMLVAGVVTGLIWYNIGATWAFQLTAFVVTLATCCLGFIRAKGKKSI